MLILYSHILINLRDADKRMKNAKRQDLEFQEQNSSSSSIRASIRVNFARNGGRHYITRAKEKTTNLALTGKKNLPRNAKTFITFSKLTGLDTPQCFIFSVVTVFMITNIPYMVDEFIRMDKSWFVS